MYYEKHRGRRTGVKHSSARRATRRAVVFLVLLVAAVALVNARLRPVLSYVVTAQAQSGFTDAVSRSIVATQGANAGSLVSFSLAEDGSVSSVQTDTARMNALKSELMLALIDGLNALDRQPIYIALGTLSGVDLFAGRGPLVEVRTELRGGVTADIVSSLEEAGINQSLHTISCEVSADYYVIMPGFRLTVRLTTTVPLAETVIVGTVPDAYTYVVGDKSDTIGRIFDYGAE